MFLRRRLRFLMIETSAVHIPLDKTIVVRPCQGLSLFPLSLSKEPFPPSYMQFFHTPCIHYEAPSHPSVMPLSLQQGLWDLSVDLVALFGRLQEVRRDMLR